jgi:hypothetical protein
LPVDDAAADMAAIRPHSKKEGTSAVSAETAAYDVNRADEEERKRGESICCIRASRESVKSEFSRWPNPERKTPAPPVKATRACEAVRRPT